MFTDVETQLRQLIKILDFARQEGELISFFLFPEKTSITAFV